MAKPTLLLDAHLKALRLPTFLREYDKVARQCAQEGLDCSRYLFRLCELELLDREQRAVERRIKAARFPVLKSLETFEFRANPVGEQTPRAGADALGISRPPRERLGVGQLRHGQDASRARVGTRGLSEGLATTAAALVNELLEARDEKRLLRLQKQLAKQDLLIVDELGYVPLSKTGAELLFENLLPALRASVNARDLESALQRMDRDLRLRTVDRCPARPADPSRPHPRAQRRQLSPRTQQESPPARGRSGILTSPPHCRVQPLNCRMV